MRASARSRTLLDTRTDRYLQPDEEKIAAIRQHPAVLIAPATQGLGALCAALLVHFAVQRGIAGDIALIIAAFFVLHVVERAISWWVDYLVLTNRRLLVTKGLYERTVEAIQLERVADVRLERNSSGRLLGYGSLHVEPGFTYHYLPYPEQVYMILLSTINHTNSQLPEIADRSEPGAGQPPEDDDDHWPDIEEADGDTDPS